MNQSIRYLYLLIFLMTSVLVTQAQVTLPEQVCVGTTQRYWVNGLPGSVFTWKVDGVVQNSTSNEINIQWSTVGTFTLEVQEHQGNCDGDIQTGQITVTDLAIPEFTVANEYCAGSVIAALPTISNNGITGTWTPAINNSETTQYTFTPDDDQCAVSAQLTITIEEQVTPQFAQVGPYCTGSTIDVLPTVSTNGITGTWSPAIDNTQTTTYTFTPDANQCATTASITVTINNPVAPTFEAIAPVCSGTSISLPVISTEGFTGSWSPEINNTSTTTYTFTPDASYPCATTAELTITIIEPVEPVFVVVGPYCLGDDIATLPITSSNGITGTWSPAINNLQTTTYTFTPDADQCAVAVELTITITDGIIPTFEAIAAICSGSPEIALPTTSQNNITGSWLPAFNNTATTEYTFTPDNGQCASITTLSVVVNDEITPVFAQVGPYCAGSTIDALPTTSENGITGSWTPAIDNTQTTTYTFTPNPDQCAEPFTMDIIIDELINPTFAAVGPYCLGATIAALPTVSENGITGSWSPAIDNTQTTEYTFTPDDGQCGTVVTLEIEITDSVEPIFAAVGPFCTGAIVAALPTTSENGITGSWSPVINNQATTTYTFTPDPDQCAEPFTLDITIDELINPTFAAVGPYCTGATIAALPTVSENGITGSWSPAIDNTQTTTYTFTPDEGQCGEETTLTITIEESITPEFAAVEPYCAGATIAALPTVSENGITGSWSPVINNTQTTEYTFTPDDGQCAEPFTLEISIDELITPTFAAVGPYCVGATIAALPTTSENGITGSWSPTINNQTTTTYTFTPDVGQCGDIITLEIEITDSVEPIFAAVGPYCVGATIAALPTTSENGITGSWSPVINNTQTTEYTFTPDDGQCAEPFTLEITIDELINPAFAAVGPFCIVATIAALPTTSDNGITGSWSPAINNQATTTYTFTPDANQCGEETTLTITIEESITPEFAAVGPYCVGATIAALPTVSENGITGSWSPAINNQTTTTYTFIPDDGQCGAIITLEIEITDSVEPIFAAVGPYCVGATIAALPTVSENGITGSWSPAIDNTQTATYTFTPDEGQCGAIITLEIEITDSVEPTFAAVRPFCVGATIAALPTVSENGITGSWSPAINNLTTTTYTFTPDEGQCGEEFTLTIDIEDSITPEFAAVGPYCVGATIAALPTVSENGITGTWSPAINNQTTTTYTFTPDEGQCGEETTLTITIEESITPEFAAVGPYCVGATIAALPTVSDNGITGSWSPAINNQTTTTYTFTPDDGQCGEEFTLTIDIEESIIPEFAAVGPYCVGATIAALPTVSENGITGSWSPAIDNTQTTEYTFTPDDGQCNEETTLTITIEESITPEFAAVGPYCVGAIIAALPTTSENGITGSWSPTIDNTQTTTYTFTPDDGQCGEEKTLTIDIEESITPEFDAVGPYCRGSVIAALPTVSDNGITGTWSPAIDNTQTTTYTFTPDDGQCGEETTLTITIEESITPEFAAVGPFCTGATIAALPTVSENGITGSWSPAIDNTQTATYTFTPNDEQCSEETTLTITIEESITPEFAAVGPYCIGATIAALPTVSENGITGSWSPAIDNTQTTEYTFTPNDGQCGEETTLTITIEEIITPEFAVVGPFCTGATIAALPTVSENGITGTWSPAIDNSQTTEYTFTPDDGQCGEETTLTITIEESITPAFDAVGPYNPGSVIALLPTVSNNGISGSWSPAINNTVTTTYTFTPDPNQCATTATLTIVITTEEITPTFDPIEPLCRGSELSLPSTSSNGITGTWSPAIDNTRTTTYTFTPDEGQGAVITTLLVVITNEVTPTFALVGPYCVGAPIEALPTVSENGITGSWSPVINNTQTATYTFTPDEDQCATTATLTISIEEGITPLFSAVGPYCVGSDIPELPTTSNNNITGTWSPAIDNTETTTYTFTPDDSECTTTVTLTIDIEESITPTFEEVGTICRGASISLPSTSNNGIRGTWSPAINNTRTTTYTFTPDDGQCGASATMTVTVTDEIIPTFDPVGPYCPGEAIAALPTTSENGIRGSWSPAINNTRTTLYTFIPESGQCGTTTTMTIVIDQSITPTFDPVGPYCEGSDIDALPTTSNNGIRGTWSPAINNTRTTTYTFTPANGQCGSPTTLVIAISDGITPTFDPVGPICSGGAIALPAISNEGVRGTWSPAIDNTETTRYTFTPNEGQCAVTGSLTVQVVESIRPTFDAFGPYCLGSDIDELPTTSNNDITGTWSPEIDNTQTTTYTFTPDAGQCGEITTLIVAIEESIIPTFDPVGPYCIGSDIDELPATSNNDITGTWSPEIDNTQTTTYTFTPDEDQCGATTSLTIVVNPELIPSFDPVSSYCRGEVVAALPGTSNNGIHGSWSPTINNTRTTTYTFTPDEDECATTATITIIIEDGIIPLFTQVGPFCPGSNIAALPTTSNNGIHGIWRPAINNTRTTTYTFTPDDDVCAATAQLTIVIDEDITPTFNPVGPFCPGSDIAALPLVSREGIAGTWSPAVNNAETTVYTFTPNEGQCGSTATLTIAIEESIIPTFDPMGPFCSGAAFTLPVVSKEGIAGTWSPRINYEETTTYVFTPQGGECGTPASLRVEIEELEIPEFEAVGPYCAGADIDALPTVSDNGIPGSWSPAINNTVTTTYTFTPEDECASNATLTVEIEESILPDFDPVSPYCLDADIDELPTTSNNGITGSWSPDIDNTRTTTYTFTPDENQCALNASLTIVIDQSITPTFDPVGPYCQGADIPELPTTSNNDITGSWSPAIDNTRTRTYTFTPDEGQCGTVATLTIAIGERVTPEFDPVATLCSGASITLPAVSNNGIRGSWSPAINNTRTTTYTFTPDRGQCATTASLTIIVDQILVPTFNPVGPFCRGTTIAALPTVSINGIRGTWSPAINNSRTTVYTFTPDADQCATAATLTIVIDQNIIPVFSAFGSYCRESEIADLPTTSNNSITGTWSPAINNTRTTTYTFTPDEDQCASEITATITITDQITPTFDPVTPICSGSAISLPVNSREGIRGTWSPAINNTRTTTYTFTPVSGQCGETAQLTVEVEDRITPTFDPIGPVCTGATITLPATSKEGVRGTWSPAINNTRTTTYTFTPNAGECAQTATLTIVVGQSVTPLFTAVGPYCIGSAIPALPTVSNNGISGRWSPAINNTRTTTYTFTPDAGECGIQTTMTITVSDEITPEFNPIGPYCTGSVIAALPTVSTNGIRGTWSPAINNTRTTTYTFTPNAGQCGVSTTMTVAVNESIRPTFDPIAAVCSGTSFTLPATSREGITGRWSPMVNNRATTTYTFTPFPGQCGESTTLTVNVEERVVPAFDPTGPYCTGSAIAALPTVSTNGIRGTWSPAINNTRTTIYTFTPDAGECATTARLTIDIDPSITPTFDPVGPYCTGSAIAALPTVSTNGIRGTWSPAINNRQTTTYTFTPAAGECARTATLIVTIADQITPTFTAMGPYCPGATIAALPTVSTNGIRGTWSPAINNRQTTVYTFTPAAGQCGTTTTMTIEINEEVTPTFDQVGPYCEGSVISALPTVSNNGIRGRWTPAINNRQTTVYTFTPDAGQCGTTATSTIEITDEVIPTFSPVGPYNSGSVIAALPTTSTNGIRGTWGPAINNTQTTVYTFTPAAGQCATTATLTITISGEVIPTFDPVGPYCEGSVIAALPTTSTNRIRGTWSPAINNRQTTTYTFTPTAGQGGTTVTLTIVITDEVIPTFNPVGPYNSGSVIAALPTTSTNGIRGTWSPAINNTQTTVYTFTPGAGQCATTATLTITISGEVIPTFDPVGPYCEGSVIAALPTTSTNRIRGTWSPAINNTQTTTYTFTPAAGQGGTTITLTIAITDEVIPTFNPVGPYNSGSVIAALPTTSTNGIRGTWAPAINNRQTTVYTFTPAAGQCATTATLTITISDLVIPTFDPVGPYCEGSTIAALPTTSTNGIRGTWSPAINNRQTTTYTFTPAAGQGASTATLTITITDELLPIFNPVGPYCVGSTIAALPTTSTNGIRGTWSPAINNRQTTTYTFTPVAGQCALSTTLTINIGTDIVPIFELVGPFCPETVIEELPRTSRNGISGTWSPVMNNMVTTDYTFTPYEGQCAVATTLTCEIGSEVTPTFEPVGPFCPGATIAALPTTSTNGVPGTWSPAIDNTQTTTYTFTPAEGQCALPTSLTITILDQVTPIFASVGSYCAGASIAALPATSTNGITGRWSPAINNMQTTTYTFTPNPGPCAATATLVIEINETRTPLFDVVGPYCPGDVIAALPTVSTNGIRGRWNPAINNRATTTYTFTPDAGQCAIPTIMIVEVENRTMPAFAPVGPYCLGSVIAALPVTSTNGITGSWSPAINNRTTTTYTFTPNPGQCAANTTLTVTVNPIPATPVTRVTQPGCITPVGTVEVTSPRGPQYQYSLDGGTYQSEPLYSGLAPESSHTLVVKDTSTGCESLPVTIQINPIPPDPAMPVAQLTVKPTCAGNGVVVVITPVGADYEYSMDGAAYQSQPVFTNVAWGDYLIRVRNVNTGCESASLALGIPVVVADMDHDGIADTVDPDADGDGILNIYEGDLTADSDGDGRMNYMDIDSDGDGITDHFEAQNLADYILPAYVDEDQNGVDDAYDKAMGGTELIPINSDEDELADFLDLDSENDMVPDYIEGHDKDANGKPDNYARGKDTDEDGLDDGYDTVVNECEADDNSRGSNASMQDFDGDGINDWRDINDDDDQYLTMYEDLNADNDYSNDDIDFDAFPEYLDYGRECDLFIPEAFSPNGDNVHDYYQVYCLNHYPNAKLYIFDQLGNKIFEKANYGNLEVWKTHEAAWWNGKPQRGPGYSRDKLVPPGTYYYVLDLGNGEVMKSFVFVSY